jgi:hypothetical protein
MIVAVTGLAVAIFAGDRYVLTPYVRARQAVAEESDRLVAKLHDTTLLFNKRKRMDKEWNQMLAGGLASNAADAERQLLAVRDWAQESGLTNLSTTPRREPRNDQTQIVRLDASANGSLASVAKLLWRIETARVPLKVDELDLRSRTDGTDDLAVTFKVSTIWVVPGEPTGKGPAGGPAQPRRTPIRAGDDL